ncbi:MAG: molybdenum ABC transporter ATP-binding protein [Acidobacteriota bacterium]
MIHASLQYRVGSLDLDVQFTLPPGVTALCGPSGSGKTTILRLLLGLSRPDGGEVRWHDQVVEHVGRGIRGSPRRRRFGALFQDGLLFPHLTVEENVSFGVRRNRSAPGTVPIDHWITLLGLRPLLHRRPAGLSGGEARRVALARALAPGPRALFLDEPLVGLDRQLKRDVLLGLRRLCREIEMPVLFVSHEVAEVLALAERVIRLGAGKILWQGEPARLLQEPDGLGTDEPINFVDARVEATRRDGLVDLRWGEHRIRTLLSGVLRGEAVTVSVRPSDLLIAVDDPGRVSAQNRLLMTIQALIPAGPRVWVRFEAPEPFLGVVTTHACRELRLAVGQPVTVLVKTLRVMS